MRCERHLVNTLNTIAIMRLSYRDAMAHIFILNAPTDEVPLGIL